MWRYNSQVISEGWTYSTELCEIRYASTELWGLGNILNTVLNGRYYRRVSGAHNSASILPLTIAPPPHSLSPTTKPWSVVLHTTPKESHPHNQLSRIVNGELIIDVVLELKCIIVLLYATK